MNERIKQFAEQAGFKTNWQHEDVQALKMARFEKFAELIVKECASQVDWILAEGGKTQGDLIKEHFGVEL
jgi:hypothetical protein